MPSRTPVALITDAHVRSVVAGIRGLGRAGVPVVALGPTAASPGLRSRYTRDAVVAPSVRDDREAFVAAVREAARAHEPAFVFPGIEDSVEALLPELDAGGPVGLAYPGRAPLDALRDKPAMAAAARAAGFAEVRELARGLAGELDAAGVEVPCVVKSATPVGRMGSALVARTRAELQEVLAGLWPEQPVVLQEHLPGPLSGVSLVLDREGRVTERFQQQAVRTWPAAAGSSAVAFGVAPDDALVEQVADLLRHTGFWGLAEVELMGSAAGPVPIDVNPRYYGSMPLALRSGSNLPAAWWRAATGEPAPPPSRYRPGVSYRWLEADVSAVLQGHRDRLRTGLGRPRAGAYWAADDPVPSALLTWEGYGERVRRRVAAVARR